MKNKITAALLAFFLGGFGIHKFYLGKTGQGILYLIFCWTFIPSFIAFIDFIILLVTSDSNFDLKYNEDYIDIVNPFSPADEIEKLNSLRLKSIITEEEYQERKNRL